MTANELLKAAVELMDDTDTTSYSETAVAKINLLLVDTFELNNNILLSKGEESLDDIPVISDINEDIVYEPELLYNVLPLGLVCMIYANESDPAMLSYYEQKYNIAKLESDRKIAQTEWY